MLFLDEAPLAGPVKGQVGLRGVVRVARARATGKGRSLREFDLTTRLFKYPCSYLIYSEAFDALPPNAEAGGLRPPVGRAVRQGWRRREGSARLRRPSGRRFIEILRETKPDLPEFSADVCVFLKPTRAWAPGASGARLCLTAAAQRRRAPRRGSTPIAPTPPVSSSWPRATTSRGSGWRTLTDTFGNRLSAPRTWRARWPGPSRR